MSASPGLAALRVHGNERPVTHIRTFKETSHWPFVTASACLGGPEHRRYLWGPAAGASTLSCIWLQPSGPLFKGRPIRLAPDSAEVFYPRRRAPSPSDPPRPTLRRGRVCDGDGWEYGGGNWGGDILFELFLVRRCLGQHSPARSADNGALQGKASRRR